MTSNRGCPLHGVAFTYGCPGCESSKPTSVRWTDGLPLYLLLCLIVAGAYVVGLPWGWAFVAALVAVAFVGSALPRRQR